MDQVQVNPDAGQESPEYIAQMAAAGESAVKAGNTQIGTEDLVGVPPKPDWVPDKFYDTATGEVNYEALSKSYQELEKKQSSKPTETDTQNGDDKSQDGKADDKQGDDKQGEGEPNKDNPTPDDANKAVEQAGLDMSKLSQEFADTGELAPESYEALEKIGIPRETVDQYIAGQAALAEQARSQAFSITEGQDGYKSMTDWARQTLSPAEMETYNTSVNSASPGVREMAVRGLWAKYNAEAGNGKPLVHGKGNVSESSGYQSRAQMVAAIQDPRYAKDPAYRKSVEDKLAVSNF
jgi:hypothetical protein